VEKVEGKTSLASNRDANS